MYLHQPATDAQQQEEDDTDKADTPFHTPIDDEGILAARLLLHHFLAGRQRGQRHSRKGVHNQVYPKYLCDGQRQFRTYEGTKEHQQQGCNVHDELEEDETLDVFIERAAPHHGLYNGAERVVYQRNVAGLLGHTGT